MSATNLAPAFSSAVVILVASPEPPERLPRYREILAAVGECSVDGYSDTHAALFAIGSRLPAAMIIDLEESNANRLSLLRSLTANPALGRTRIIAVGECDAAMVELRERNALHTMLRGGPPRIVDSKTRAAPLHRRRRHFSEVGR
jgi:hypothetical protein